jgi:hypothetical protein
VTESGTGRAIAGATVAVFETASTTDQKGFYQLQGLFGWQLQGIQFSKTGFETMYASYNGNPLDVRLQTSLVVAVGGSVRSAVYPDDPEFSDLLSDNVCGPCKLIHVTVPTKGRLMIRVLVPPDSQGAGVMIETGGGSTGISCCAFEITRTVGVDAGEDVKLRVYTDPAPQTPLPFEIVTSFQ